MGSSSLTEDQKSEEKSKRYQRAQERNVRKNLTMEKEIEDHELSDLEDKEDDEIVDLSGIMEISTTYIETFPMNEKEECARSDTTCQTDSELCGMCDASCQTDMSFNDILKLEFELQQRNNEIHELQEKILQASLNEDSFKDNDEKVLFYTGLPKFALMMTVFHFLESFINTTARTSLSKFQQFLLTMMRLRLNLPLCDLGYRFGVSTSTASRVFTAWLDVTYIRLSPLIKWPSREELWKTMPLSFRKHFGTKVTIIIDCFEVFCDKPSNLLARAATFSTYKHHNTVKFLIGISPQGAVSFISDAWGGRASDKHITEASGLLDKLLPGDLILADRGFDIDDSVAAFYAEVKIPDFTRGKKQLAPLEVERTRKIASSRVHVERVIGNVRRKYTILQGTLPVDYLTKSKDSGLTAIDKLVTVCCALTNLCDSVIPFE